MRLTHRQSDALLRLRRAGGSLTWIALHETLGRPRNTVDSLDLHRLVTVSFGCRRGQRLSKWVDLTPKGRRVANAEYRRWKKAVGQ